MVAGCGGVALENFRESICLKKREFIGLRDGKLFFWYLGVSSAMKLVFSRNPQFGYYYRSSSSITRFRSILLW